MTRPRVRVSVSINRAALLALTFLALMLAACDVRVQSQSATPGVTEQSTQPKGGTPLQSPAPATPSDELTQMRTDLDRMDSLLGNMSSEIEFLRDQNLQILLRTNSQMWTILIRDLRRHIDREEHQRSQAPQPQSGPKPTPPR